jgi:hypothetical protein
VFCAYWVVSSLRVKRTTAAETTADRIGTIAFFLRGRGCPFWRGIVRVKVYPHHEQCSPGRRDRMEPMVITKLPSIERAATPIAWPSPTIRLLSDNGRLHGVDEVGALL